jgi:cytoskeletal protein RodZ
MVADKDISLGEFLRQERERRGITIEQVASATKVGVRTLHSLEADHYVELPAKPFIRGFVTSYCRFIGLDPKETLARYDQFISSKGSERPNRESGHSGYAFEKKDGEQQSRTILLIAMCSFVVLGGIAMLFFKPSLRHHRSSHLDKLRATHHAEDSATSKGVGPSPLPSVLAEILATPSVVPSIVPIPAHTPVQIPPVVPVPTPTQSSAPEVAATPKAAEEAPEPTATWAAGGNSADPLDSGLELKHQEIRFKISMKIQSDIWVRYQVDGRPVRKFIIRQGRSLILRAKDTVKLQVSKPDSVLMKVNGQPPELFSKYKGIVIRNGDATVFFPNEISSQFEKPFGDVGPLSRTVSASPERSSQENTPSQ